MFRFIHRIANSKLTGIALAVVFLSVLSLSLFHMPAGMEMTGSMSGCPFMGHEETICSMSVVDHIGAWKSAFLATIPGFTLLLSALAAAVVIFTVAPNLLLKQRFRVPVISKEVVERVYTFSYRPLQELFSSGILHPKLF